MCIPVMSRRSSSLPVVTFTLQAQLVLVGDDPVGAARAHVYSSSNVTKISTLMMIKHQGFKLHTQTTTMIYLHIVEEVGSTTTPLESLPRPRITPIMIKTTITILPYYMCMSTSLDGADDI